MKTLEKFLDKMAVSLSRISIFSAIVLIIALFFLSSCTASRYTCPTYAKVGTNKAQYNPVRFGR